MNILVRSPNWLGDQVLAYPFFAALRRAYPDARILAACVPWVEAVQYRHLVDQVHVLPLAAQPSLFARLKALEFGAQELRSLGPWDLGVALPNSFSSAWVLLRAGCRQRRGYAADGRGVLLNDGLPWSAGGVAHRAEAYARLLPARTGFDASSAPRWWGAPGETELDAASPGLESRFDFERAWADAEFLEPPSEAEGPYWVLAPGAKAETRRWPPERFAEIAARVLRETGWRGVIAGGPGETLAAQRILGLLSPADAARIQDLTGQGSVAAFARIFAGARFTLANDSGLAHVAALCGSPTAVAWGAGDPKRTRPLGPGRVELVLNAVECWPCEKNACPLPNPSEKRKCLLGVEVDAVWQAIQRLTAPR